MDKDLDFEKLQFMKKLVKLDTPDTKLDQYNRETHHIMQRHYKTPQIIECGKLLLLYIKIIQDDKKHLKQMKRERYYLNKKD